MYIKYRYRYRYRRLGSGRHWRTARKTPHPLSCYSNMYDYKHMHYYMYTYMYTYKYSCVYMCNDNNITTKNLICCLVGHGEEVVAIELVRLT